VDAPLYVRWSSQENEELVVWESVNRPYEDFSENPECLECMVVCNLGQLEIDSVDSEDFQEMFVENFSKEAFEAWDQRTSSKRLKTFLGVQDPTELSFALQNPTSPKDSVREIANKQLVEWRDGTGSFKFLSNPCFWQTEQDAFRKKLAQQTFKNIQHRIATLSIDDLEKELKSYLQFYGYWIRNKAGFDDDENEFEYQSEIEDVFVEYWYAYEYYHFCASILKYGDKRAKRVFQEVDSITFDWLNCLFEKELLEPFLYWTDDNDHIQLFFNQHRFRRIGEDSGYDPIPFLKNSGLPEIFSPTTLLEEPLPLFNIESGEAAIWTSSKIENNSKDVLGVKVVSGLGDGVYGMYPIFDQIGELQMLVALFVDVRGGADWILSNTFHEGDYEGIPNFRNHVPVPLAKVICDGDFTVTDFSNLQNGVEKGQKIVVFENLPKDEYLIMGYLDCSLNSGFGVSNSWDGGIDFRCSAVAAVRGRARYLLEQFFELFPILEREKIASLVPGFVSIKGADLAEE
jgi:hypothetical protein